MSEHTIQTLESDFNKLKEDYSEFIRSVMEKLSFLKTPVDKIILAESEGGYPYVDDMVLTAVVYECEIDQNTGLIKSPPQVWVQAEKNGVLIPGVGNNKVRTLISLNNFSIPVLRAVAIEVHNKSQSILKNE